MIKIIVTRNPDPTSDFQKGVYDVGTRNPQEVLMKLRACKCDWQLAIDEESKSQKIGIAWLICDIALHVIDAGSRGKRVFLDGEIIEHDSADIVDKLLGAQQAFGSVPWITSNYESALVLLSH